MRSRRTVILIVAVVVGAIASFGLLNYIRNVEGSVYDNAAPETVWVVRQAIAKGTPADQALSLGLLARSEIPASFKPATAIVDVETELAGLVAVTDLPANATLVAGLFVSPDVVNTGITDRLAERDLVTVTFSVDQIRGAAYMIEPGDFVNVMSVEALTAAAAPANPEGGGAVPLGVNAADPWNATARYVFQKAEVLAIDKSLTPDLGESVEQNEGRNSGMITLAVPPAAVQVILSVGLENLYLSLVPPDYVPVPLPPLNYGDLGLPAENPAELTPYGPDPGAGAQ